MNTSGLFEYSWSSDKLNVCLREPAAARCSRACKRRPLLVFFKYIAVRACSLYVQCVHVCLCAHRPLSPQARWLTCSACMCMHTDLARLERGRSAFNLEHFARLKLSEFHKSCAAINGNRARLAFARRCQGKPACAIAYYKRENLQNLVAL